MSVCMKFAIELDMTRNELVPQAEMAINALNATLSSIPGLPAGGFPKANAPIMQKHLPRVRLPRTSLQTRHGAEHRRLRVGEKLCGSFRPSRKARAVPIREP